MAFAIRIGLFAFAIAELTNTPSHPNSIAITASEAVPMPASTMTGIFDCCLIICIFILFGIPWPIQLKNLEA